jgi:hypothetical protein
MSQGLLTGGYESSGGSASGGGGGGPSGIRVYFSLVDKTTGAYTSGIDLSAAGVVQVSKNGDAYANGLGAAPTDIGGGDYYYELDASEVDTPPTVIVKVVKNGYAEIHAEKDIGSPAQVSDVTAATTNAISTILSAIGAAQLAIEDHVDAELFGTGGSISDSINAARDDVKSHVDSTTATLTTLINRLLGLHGDNSLLDGGAGSPALVYLNGLLVGARVRVFASSAALAAATAGAADNADGEVFRWNVTGTNASGLSATLRRSRAL